MRRLADRFGAAAVACSSLEDLRQLLLAAAGDLGFDYVALLHHASLGGRSAGLVRIDNYPEGWIAELTAGNLHAHDPVHRASRRAAALFDWTELGRLVPLGAEARLILDRSRRFGIGEGMTVPVNVLGEPSGSCSFAVRRGRALRPVLGPGAQLIGLHAFEAARRLAGMGAPARPHLSRRELQCVRLVARGKSDWEIAAILGLAVETARFYVKSARRAYGVATRTQLALLALRDAWLDFDDALAGGEP